MISSFSIRIIAGKDVFNEVSFDVQVLRDFYLFRIAYIKLKFLERIMLNQDSVVADMLILKLLLPSRFGKSESLSHDSDSSGFTDY